MSKQDKFVIASWLQLYNRLNGATFKIDKWPDDDSSKKNIDAVCRDDAGVLLAVEHTLIEPFDGEKKDAARLLETIGGLDNHPDLALPGHPITASLPVGAISTGSDWAQIAEESLNKLKVALPALPEGDSTVPIEGASWNVSLQISKMQVGTESNPGAFRVGRVWPGDPGTELVVRALERKIPKLSAFVGGRRILLLEQDAIAGTTERQFEQLPDDQHVRDLLGRIDEVWSVKTPGLRGENTIFTSQFWPEMYVNRCSLNLSTGRFWRGPC